MDPRRHLILILAALSLGGCAVLRGPVPPRATLAPPEVAAPDAPGVVDLAPAVLPPRTFAFMAPIPNPPSRSAGHVASPATRRLADASAPPAPSGRPAIAAANHAARESSRPGGFIGGVQVFAYDAGRVYEVWTAPLRVTTLSLSPGETVIAKAAGDTVRWQIGETRSGEGPTQRAHVMIKPLTRGLETNLVLTTNRRVYLLQLRSGDPTGFNAAVTWDLGALIDAALPEQCPAPPPTAASAAIVEPQGPLDAGFRIRPKGRRPAWTPSAVATDGVRTFLSFPPGLTAGAAPALFAVGPAGQPQLVNYRQQGALWVVDQVLWAAELRMGGRHAAVVRIVRIGAPS